MIPAWGRSPGEGIDYPLQYSYGFPCGSAGKESTWQCGRPGFDPCVGKIPWRGEMLPTPVFWPGEFHRLYSSWGRKESDMTEWFSLSLYFNRNCLVNIFTEKFITDAIPFSSVAQSCSTLRNLMDLSTPGLPLHHQLPEFTQTHLH